MSGWKMTSILGSLINRTVIHTVCGVLNIEYRNLLVQGDDAVLFVRRPEHADLIAEMMNELGYKVSPQKNFVSDYGFEFLRKFYDVRTHSWQGYWPRTVSSIIFFKPWKQPHEVQDPFEIADSW